MLIFLIGIGIIGIAQSVTTYFSIRPMSALRNSR